VTGGALTTGASLGTDVRSPLFDWTSTDRRSLRDASVSSLMPSIELVLAPLSRAMIASWTTSLRLSFLVPYCRLVAFFVGTVLGFLVGGGALVSPVLSCGGGAPERASRALLDGLISLSLFRSPWLVGAAELAFWTLEAVFLGAGLAVLDAFAFAIVSEVD